MKTLNYFWHFVIGSVAVVSRGTRAYYAWIALLFTFLLSWEKLPWYGKRMRQAMDKGRRTLRRHAPEGTDHA